MLKLIKSEPAMFVALVGSVIGVAVAFGLNVTNEQTGVVLAFVTLIVGFVTRTQVTASAVVVAKAVDGNVVAGPAYPAEDGTVLDLPPVATDGITLDLS